MERRIYKAIGLMSGTSMDGIDAAIIATDGHIISSIIGGTTLPYTDEFRNKLQQLIVGKGNKQEVERELTILHSKAVSAVLDDCDEDTSSIDFIGFHGHTIDHRPHDGVTTQIGDGKLLQELTKITVINDFRSADVKAGGQGAPLVPVYHQALLHNEEKPIAVVNIGGVANVTWIGKNAGDLLAFDTGPGNALLDDWIKAKTEKHFDNGGKLAKKGKINKDIVATLMADKFFATKPPKSLDRNHFSSSRPYKDLSTEDGAASLVAFTAESIATAEKFFPEAVNKWLVSGGGRHNIAIMDSLKKLLNAPVLDINEIGNDGDLLEAQAFAFLAVRTALGLPISFPGTTGVKAPICGGVMWKK